MRRAKFEDCDEILDLMKEINLGLILAAAQLGSEADRPPFVVAFAGCEPRRIATLPNGLAVMLLKFPAIVSVFGADSTQKGAGVLGKELNVCHPMAAMMGCCMETYGLWLAFFSKCRNPTHFDLYSTKEAILLARVKTFLASDDCTVSVDVRNLLHWTSTSVLKILHWTSPRLTSVSPLSG